MLVRLRIRFKKNCQVVVGKLCELVHVNSLSWSENDGITSNAEYVISMIGEILLLGNQWS